MANGKKSRDLVADYFDVFNGEVKQFLDPFASNDYELEGSRVHMDSKVSWLEDNEKTDDAGSASDPEVEFEAGTSEDSYDDEERYETAEEYQEEATRGNEGTFKPLGSFWSVAEKIVFFHCLSRYSIHCLDHWRNRLPMKSKFEILVYYKVLKENLDHLKSSGNKLGGILSRADLPIAYEMDEFYISFEERMSARVRLESEKPVTDPEEQEAGLLCIENWNKRWLPVYSKTRAHELTPACFQPLPFSQDAIEHLTKRCIDYTRQLLTAAVLADLEKVSIPVAMFRGQQETEELGSDEDTLIVSNSKKGFPHVVTKESIVNAVYLLRQEGFRAPTLAETVLRTLQKFELRHEENGKVFRNRFVTKSLVPSLLENLPNPEMPSATQENALPPKKESDLALIKKLYKMNGGKPPSKRRRLTEPHDRFLYDDELDRMDNPLELELCDWETQLLEAADMRESRLHQHAMLAYFTSDKTLITIDQSKIPESASKCPIPLIPATMINRYLHSNT